MHKFLIIINIYFFEMLYRVWKKTSTIVDYNTCFTTHTNSFRHKKYKFKKFKVFSFFLLKKLLKLAITIEKLVFF